MERLQLDYLDLYLIHWPLPMKGLFRETWRAFEKLYEDKRIRAIGVSNFKPSHLEKLLTTAKVVPTVNQIELHPFMQQHETRDYCAQHDIKVESWSPLMQGGEILTNKDITAIAESHKVTPAQVVIRWHLQNGLIVIPKSVHEPRIKENFDVFKFELSPEDMSKIDALDQGQRLGADPDSASFS